MRSVGANIVHSSLGAAIISVLWSAVTNYFMLGYVPVSPLIVAAIGAGVSYAVVYTIVHAVGRLNPTFLSAFVSALITVGIWLTVSIIAGTFVGWSVPAVGALLLLSVMVGGLTNFIAAKF